MILAGRVPVILVLITLVSGCTEGQGPLAVSDMLELEPAGAPIGIPFVLVQEDVINPCTGLLRDVTFTGTFWFNENGRVMRAKFTLSSTDGFEGRQTGTAVSNGKIFKLSINTTERNPETGAGIRGQEILVVDVSTTPPTVRVEKGTFGGPVCVND